MRPPSLGAVAALVAVVLSAIVAVSVLGGGQVSMILSTVGSSVSGAVDTPAAGDEGDGIVATIGDLPDDAETLPDIDGKPAFAVSRFGYRFHFYADEALMTLVVARIGAVGRSATPEA